MSLSCASELANSAVRGETNMRGEEDKQVSISRDVMTVGSESHFSNEWQTTQASHAEAFTPEVCQLPVDACAVVIDFIGANTAGKKSVFWVASNRQHCIVDLCE